MEIWKPIETARQNSTIVLVKRDDLQESVHWSRALNDWVIEGVPTDIGAKVLSWKPTHWRQLARLNCKGY
jgi:hypothetical protein